jgi:hypothetical protein
MNPDDEHLDHQDQAQLPTAVGEEAPPPPQHELVLQAAETVRRIVEGERQ